MHFLSERIAEREDWLMNRTILYAKRHGYAQYTSTLTEAWRSAICGMSEPLIEALNRYEELPPVTATGDYADDPIAAFGIQTARRHRSRGITLALFLGLMKYYRQTYLDLLDLPEIPAERRPRYGEFINRFFDRLEIAFCSEWASQHESALVLDAAERNRILTNEKNKYLTIFESLKDPVVLLDTDGGIENASYAAAQLFGGSTVPGAGYYGAEHLPLLESVLPSLIGNDGEHMLSTALGPRCFEIKSQPMLDVSEKFAGTVLIFNDVSDYKDAMLRAEQASRTKSAFLAAMSHEIRTPINGIVGTTTLLRDTALNAQQGRYVDLIATSGEMLSSLIADILDYSKIEAGVLEVENIDFDVGALIGDVLSLMVPTAAAKGLALTSEVDPALSARINGDFGKLRQILVNLVSNAVKFTESGSVRVGVEEASPWLRFSVIDTGIGISESGQTHLFSAFAQADASVSRRFGGTGLGLAICRKLVDALDGQIGLKSAINVGSTFWFQVPLRYCQTGSVAHGDGAEHSIPPLEVLLAEDNEINRVVATGLLQRLGHRVTAAVSGGEALARAEERRFDLILMDLNLPEVSGLECIRRLRAHADPAIAGLPILVVSALVTRDDIQASRAAGADAFLGKPYRPERLEETLRTLWRREAEEVKAAVFPDEVHNAPAANAQNAVGEIDESILARHVEELGSETTHRIIELFVANAEAAFQEARKKLGENAIEEAVRAIHRLKSSAWTLGLGGLAGRAAEFEAKAAIDSESIEALTRQLDEMRQALPAALAALAAAWAALEQAARADQNRER